VELLEDRTLPSTLTVLNTNDSGADSLRQDILDAAPGSTIVFQQGLTGTITLSDTLNIAKDLTIVGPGSGSLTISGNHTVQDFTVSASVTASFSGLTIADAKIINAFSLGGAGIQNFGTLTVSNCVFSGNSADSAGGLYNGGTLTLSNSTFLGNSATDGSGGGLYNDAGSTATVSGCTFSGNTAGNIFAGFGGIGAGAYNAGTLSVTDSIFSSNSVDPSLGGAGSGIFNDFHGALTVSTSTFSGNLGNVLLNFYGTVTISDSAFSANLAIESNAAAILNYSGRMTISGSTFSGNSATDFSLGGAIANGDIMTISNSTFFGNSASVGGAIYNEGTLTVCDSTLAGNSATFEGGGLYNDFFGTLTLANSIVALNTAGFDSPDISGIVTANFSLIQNTGGIAFTAASGGNLTGVDPLLGPLQDNGGPTQTMALLPGSPAINAGSNALAVDPATNQPLTTDQRGAGYSRIVNGTVDVGAFEVQLVATTTTVTSSADSSILDQPVTLTATVLAASGSATPTGTVTFMDGSTPLATVTLDSAGQARWTTAALSVGSHAITAVYNPTGNFLTSSGSLTQSVDYQFGGFLPPLAPDGDYQLGRVIPIKFLLTDFYGNPITGLGAVESLQIQQVTAGGQPLGAAFAPASPGNTALRNNGPDFIFNWQTKGLAAGLYEIIVTLADGTVHTIEVQLVS
jgi:hypothetical protein